MFVFVSRKFRQELPKIANNFNLDNFVCKIESENSLNKIRSVFDPIPPYWKKRIGTFRIIAKYLEYENENVLALLDILDHGATYESFNDDPRSFGLQKLDCLIDDNEISNELSKREQKRIKDGIIFKERIKDQQRLWLKRPGWSSSNSIADSYTILESDEWVKRMRKREFNKFWPYYFNLIIECLGADSSRECTKFNPLVYRASKQDHSILFSFFKLTNNFDNFSRNALFLIAPFNKPVSDSDIANFFKISPIEEFYATHSSLELNSDELTAYCAKSYPDGILGVDATWCDIETEEGVNLALSIEEENVLHATSAGDKDLPIFINGRAGSGKSTMLYYLFSDYCYRKWFHKLPESPLFITYSDKLLENAQESIKMILNSHHRYLYDSNATKEFLDIDKYFLTFSELLFSFLTDDDTKLFPTEKYISFNRFKRLYKNIELSETDYAHGCKLRETGRWSSEFCWHIIRSFIKGYNAFDFLEYSDLQKKDRESFRSSDFQSVYDTIFLRWYHKLSTNYGFWDDQDLIRFILNHATFQTLYPAIFCDESQDFTRIELQLINRIFLFSNLKLFPQDFDSLPIAFAGDPLQTLQPTGFRWSSTKSVFYDEIIKTIDPNSSLNLNISYIDLDMNYRSTVPITQFANYIQYLRKTLFNIDNLKPQTNLKKRDSFEPKKFIIDDNITFKELYDLIQDTTIIVPCEKDQEIEFINSDSLLKRLVPLDPGGDPPKTVLSAVNAKGLEFPRVIVYKFGKTLNSDVKDLINSESYDKLEHEYFFNKLYVAISRAMSKLFILDYSEGDSKLWKYLSDNDYYCELKSLNKKDAEWDLKHIGILAKGSSQDAKHMREDDPLSVADEYRRKGERMGDPGLLRRAKQYYSGLGEIRNADICEALALKYESKTQEAGNLFAKLEEFCYAFDCYWDGMHFDKLIRIQDKYDATDKHYKITIAKFILSRESDHQSIVNFQTFLNILHQHRESFRSKQASKAISTFYERLKRKNDFDFNKEEWLSFGSTLQLLFDKGFRSYLDLTGLCYFNACNYSDAAKTWERNKGTSLERKEYFLAKAKNSLTTLERFSYLEKAGLFDEIVQEWEADSKITVVADPRYLRFVAPALEHLGRYHDAFNIYLMAPKNEKFLEKAAETFFRINNSAANIELSENLVKLFDIMIHANLWELTIETIEKCKNSIHTETISEISYDILREIAYSDLRSDKINIDIRNRFEKFVEEVLSRPEWEEHLSIQQAGAALERVGGLVAALKFYQHFWKHEDATVVSFSRCRWLITKHRQHEYEANKGNHDRAEQHINEIRKRMKTWGFGTLENFLKIMPVYPELENRDIEGVPIGTKVTRNPDETTIYINNIELRIKKESKLVMIMDTNDYKQVRIDTIKRDVFNADNVKVEADKIQFMSLTSGYQGVILYFDKQIVIELNLRGITNPIIVKIK